MQKKVKINPKILSFKIVFILVAVICVLVIIYPFIPQLFYWFKYDVFDYQWEQQDTFDITSTSEDSNEESDEIEINGNRIIIPAIGVDVQIVEGESDNTLNLGAWHRPDTGDPVKGGNMVITGHRFQYLPPNNLTFYHLDKVKEGDLVIVYWNEIEYDYSVVETFVVGADAIEIEEQTANNVLTLYTCTPLWTAEKRLVVRAEPID